MRHTHNVPARRHFLRMSARLAGLGLSSLGLEPARQFFVRDVQAQRRVTDYKALVCVYMFGGNDANNLIVPVDNYTAYRPRAEARPEWRSPPIPCYRFQDRAAPRMGCTRRSRSLRPSTTPATWRSC